MCLNCWFYLHQNSWHFPTEAIWEGPGQNKSPSFPVFCVLFALVQDIKPFCFVLSVCLSAWMLGSGSFFLLFPACFLLFLCAWRLFYVVIVALVLIPGRWPVQVVAVSCAVVCCALSSGRYLCWLAGCYERWRVCCDVVVVCVLVCLGTVLALWAKGGGMSRIDKVKLGYTFAENLGA